MPKTTPLHDNHAIKEVIFSLNFSEALDTESIKKILGLNDILKNDFPVFEELRMHTFKISPKQAPQQNKNTGNYKLAGVRLLHKNKSKNSTDWVAHIENNIISISCLDYKGWEKSWPKARAYLETLAEQVNKSNKVKAIILQYTNIFNSDSSDASTVIKEVLNPDSPYLSDTIKKTSSLWHIFQGWLEEDAIIKCDCLNNLNISVEANEPNIRTKIVLFRQAQLDSFVLSNLDLVVNSLHDNIKTMLSRLLRRKAMQQVDLLREGKKQ